MGILSTLLGLTANVADPSLNDVVPSTFSVTFFLTFFGISKVTVPVGTPAPGASGWISAFRPSDTILCFFLKTGCGTRTTWVAALETDSVEALDAPGKRSESPL